MRVCREIQRWVNTNVLTPMESWASRAERRCRTEPCNWWCLCCNKWFCWIAVIVVRIVTWVLTVVSRLITELVCEIVGFVLDVIAFIFNLILSIPIIGGIIRTIWNWITEIVWRVIGLPDFLLTLAGVQIPKKMYARIIILNNGGTPISTEAAILPSMQLAQQIFLEQCNVNLIYTGSCSPQLSTPDSANNIDCGAGGFFSDWWVAGAYYEFVSSTCAFKDGHRRLIGYGAELIAMVIQTVNPGTTNGCSMGPTHNYIVVEPGSADLIAHEFGHACLLPHVDGINTRLMFPSLQYDSTGRLISRELTNTERAVLRNSRHCVFI